MPIGTALNLPSPILVSKLVRRPKKKSGQKLQRSLRLFFFISSSTPVRLSLLNRESRNVLPQSLNSPFHFGVEGGALAKIERRLLFLWVGKLPWFIFIPPIFLSLPTWFTSFEPNFSTWTYDFFPAYIFRLCSPTISLKTLFFMPNQDHHVIHGLAWCTPPKFNPPSSNNDIMTLIGL